MIGPRFAIKGREKEFFMEAPRCPTERVYSEKDRELVRMKKDYIHLNAYYGSFPGAFSDIMKFFASGSLLKYRMKYDNV